MTRKTSTMASSSVFTTSFTEMRTKGVVSYGIDRLHARREKLPRVPPPFFSPPSTVSSALAPDAGRMAMPLAGLPL